MEFFQQYGMTILMVVGLVVVFYLMWRSNKKQEKETQNMRDSLEVGDEITTIGGIIGEIVRIKEETVTIETGKDRTKIRILRSAVRSVDVYAAEKRGEAKKVDDASGDKNTKKAKLEKANLKSDKADDKTTIEENK
ncbi:MAG: preprotein translocase subunit YajC [Clostridia bacterium]|nr:preprotein translocase subunit YajC [Clostridia bacterium]